MIYGDIQADKVYYSYLSVSIIFIFIFYLICVFFLGTFFLGVVVEKYRESIMNTGYPS